MTYLQSGFYHAGLNGNTHPDALPHTRDALSRLGVRYDGGGDWTLPLGAAMRHVHGEEWELTLADGSVYDVWAED